MKRRKNLALSAAILIAAAPVAASGFSCECLPCPLEAVAACDSEPAEPCCSEPEEKAPACACAHLETPAALPSGGDALISPCTMPAEAPVQTLPLLSAVPEAVRPPGRDPPSGPIALFLLNLALRL